MAIIAKAKGDGPEYIPAPEGTHAAVCCDIVDLGEMEVSFGGKKKTQHKVNIVWQLDDVRADNRPYQVQKRYTLSLYAKSSLRKDLESWRGKTFSDSELAGFDLENLMGVAALVNVLHNVKDGNTYANVVSVMRLPKTMEAPKIRDYIRVCDRTPDYEAKGNQAEPEAAWATTDDDVPF